MFVDNSGKLFGIQFLVALAGRLGIWTVAALIISSRLVKGEGGLVTAAFEDRAASAVFGLIAPFLSFEAALEGMKTLVPLTLIFREISCEPSVALANVSSAGAYSVRALDILGAVLVGEKPESVAQVFSFAALFSIAVFLVQASVTLLEFLARSINFVQWLAVAARCKVVRAFWKTEATVVAVSAEFSLVLEPEDDDLELPEPSHADFVHWAHSGLFTSLQIHDQLVDFVDGVSGDIGENIGVEVSGFFSRKVISNIPSSSAESYFASKSTDSEKVEKLHFFTIVCCCC